MQTQENLNVCDKAFEEYSATLFFDNKPFEATMKYGSNFKEVIIKKKYLLTIYNLKPEASAFFDSKWGGNSLPLYSFATMGESLVKAGFSNDPKTFEYYTLFVYWAQLFHCTKEKESLLTIHLPNKSDLINSLTFTEIISGENTIAHTKIIEEIFSSKTSIGTIQIQKQTTAKERKPYSKKSNVEFQIRPVIFPVNI